jgi:hypothetical protein
MTALNNSHFQIDSYNYNLYSQSQSSRIDENNAFLSEQQRYNHHIYSNIEYIREYN